MEKGLYLLSIASSNANISEIAKWSIEKRDVSLIYLRVWMFGEQFINVAGCPSCQEKVEWQMKASDFSLPSLPLEKQAFPLQYSADEFQIDYRLPTSEDLLSGRPDDIMTKCLLGIKKNGKDYKGKKLPESIFEALGKEMERVSPLTNISFHLNCPSCDHTWEMKFDIITYLWQEIDNWAKNILQEIYLLASTFGWSERDILSMSSIRRQYYLGMIQA